VAFVLDEKVYEDEDGEERRINIVKEGTTRRPTDEELDQVHKDLEGTGILASPSDGKAELEAASESSEEDDSSDEEDDPEREFANIPF
jgi:hypothetical protein